MAIRIDCYVDTSAFIAFMDKSDSFHTVFHRLFSVAQPLITSALVVAECHSWLLRRYNQQRAIRFLAFIDDLPNLTIQAFDAVELAKAGLVIKKYSDQNLSMADAHGIAIMRDLRIGFCWSTDRHLGLGGVQLVN